MVNAGAVNGRPGYFRRRISAILLPISAGFCNPKIRLNMRADLQLTIYRAFSAAAPTNPCEILPYITYA
jgi:hypothetical protein